MEHEEYGSLFHKRGAACREERFVILRLERTSGLKTVTNVGDWVDREGRTSMTYFGVQRLIQFSCYKRQDTRDTRQTVVDSLPLNWRKTYLTLTLRSALRLCWTNVRRVSRLDSLTGSTPVSVIRRSRCCFQALVGAFLPTVGPWLLNHEPPVFGRWTFRRPPAEPTPLTGLLPVMTRSKSPLV